MYKIKNAAINNYNYFLFLNFEIELKREKKKTTTNTDLTQPLFFSSLLIHKNIINVFYKKKQKKNGIYS